MENGEYKLIGSGPVWGLKGNQVSPCLKEETAYMEDWRMLSSCIRSESTYNRLGCGLTGFYFDFISFVFVFKANQWKTSYTSQQLPGREGQREANSMSPD